MAEPTGGAGVPAGDRDDWDATWEAARRQRLDSTLAATPLERLEWLEEMLEIAHRAGALGPAAGEAGPRSVP